MTTGQGTQTGTNRDAERATSNESQIGPTALRELLYLGAGLAIAGAVLGVAGAVSATPLLWAFGLGAAAVSLSVLAVSGYHGRGQSA